MPNTTSLEWSKKLKEAGIEIKTEKYWVQRIGYPGKPVRLVSVEEKDTLIKSFDEDWIVLCSSPTVTELMDKMILGVNVEKIKSTLTDTVFYRSLLKGECVLNKTGFDITMAPTPQDSLAQLFIYIK